MRALRHLVAEVFPIGCVSKCLLRHPANYQPLPWPSNHVDGYLTGLQAALMIEVVQLDVRAVEGIHEEIRVGPSQKRFLHENAAAGLVDIGHFDAVAGVTAVHLEVAQGCLNSLPRNQQDFSLRDFL
jgi:ubiquinone/menaquinone biosynthesis C-methylase UbiE